MDLVVQSVAGVIYPVDVQSLVIQSIVAIVINIDVMKIPSMYGHWYRVVRIMGHELCEFTTNEIQAQISSAAA